MRCFVPHAPPGEALPWSQSGLQLQQLQPYTTLGTRVASKRFVPKCLVLKRLIPNAFVHSLRSPHSIPPLHPSRRATTLLTRSAQVVTAAGKKLGAAELDRIAAEGANNETKRLVALGRGVAQSAWEASVGRIAKERNVTMGEATGDFATQTGEAQADFDSSFGACEAEKNRTSALVANDQASVARIKSLMLTLKDHGCNGQDMKKLTPLIPRPPEPTRAERIAILRQGQNGATAPMHRARPAHARPAHARRAHARCTRRVGRACCTRHARARAPRAGPA